MYLSTELANQRRSDYPSGGKRTNREFDYTESVYTHRSFIARRTKEFV
jgi:hypothetical protein